MLSPDVISLPRGGSTAKGRALLAPAAPGSLAGALVIWAVAGDGVCQGSRHAGGRGGGHSLSLRFWDAAREKKQNRGMEGGMGAGGLQGSHPAIPLLTALGRGQMAAVKPDVRWASLAEQVGPGWGHLCWRDTCGWSPASWRDLSELGVAAGRQRRCLQEAASSFGDGFGEVYQGEVFCRVLQVRGDGERPKGARKPPGTPPQPLALLEHRGCRMPGANFKPWPETRSGSLLGRQGQAGQ